MAQTIHATSPTTAEQAAAPFSALSKAFESVDWCLENRRPRHSLSQPVLSFGYHGKQLSHPDEEKGRKYKGSIDPASTKLNDSSMPAFAERAFNSTTSSEVAGDDEEDAWIDGLAGPTIGLTLADAFAPPADTWQLEFERARPGQSTVRLDWHTVVDETVASALEIIDMSGQGVTDIPDCVCDLGTMRKLPTFSKNMFNQSLPASFGRTQSGPLAFGQGYEPASRKRHFGRTSSGSLAFTSEAVKTAVPLQINLNNNSITADNISPALFTLSNLRMLFLRQNQLSSVPAGFGRMTGLVELSLAGNKIEVLPAEILNLRNLSRLTLHPNPLRQPPAKFQETASGRLLGQLTVYFAIPSLHEIAVRSFLSLHLSGLFDAARGRDALASLPTHLEAPFENMVTTPSWYGSRRQRQASSGSDAGATTSPGLPFDPLSNVCRSPAHGGQERVFYRPAVERIEWVSESYLVGGSASGTRSIPILHRGCGRRCLDWLEVTAAE
ncbi:hypothetical protein OIV83_000466 [Microbotryomycetes sp. JL201]|nr:hypothetical protein OIV83_000466 [Microbotryomycetes sp. JL201]